MCVAFIIRHNVFVLICPEDYSQCVCVCAGERHQPRSACKSDRTFVWPLNRDHPSESSFSFPCGETFHEAC